jgi:hypothetical protein
VIVACGEKEHSYTELEFAERVLGAEHPNTLATRRNLAHWAGQADE